MKKKLLATLICSSLMVSSTQSVAPVAAAFWAFVLRSTAGQKAFATLITVNLIKNAGIVNDPKQYHQESFSILGKIGESIKLLGVDALNFGKGMTAMATPSFGEEHPQKRKFTLTGKDFKIEPEELVEQKSSKKIDISGSRKDHHGPLPEQANKNTKYVPHNDEHHDDELLKKLLNEE
jgi:hypothetical protein